jgi:hypothetical protein
LGGLLFTVLYEEQLPVGVAVRRAAHPRLRLQPSVMAAGGAGEAAQIVLFAFFHVSFILHSSAEFILHCDAAELHYLTNFSNLLFAVSHSSRLPSGL